jgi:capsid portal protein
MVLRGVTSNPRIVDPEHANIRDAGMSVVKLNDAENKELLFGNYDKQCSDRIRSAFRLPPIVVGLTDDYNRATSTTSLKVAEQQVFALERKFFEDIFNNKLLTDQNGETFKAVKIKLNVSSIESKEDEATFLETMSKVGALTPNMALTEYNKFTGNDYELFQEDWANRPMALGELMMQQAFSATDKGVNYDPFTGEKSTRPAQPEPKAKEDKTK